MLAEGLLTPETLVALGARLEAARTAAEMADDTPREDPVELLTA